MQADSAYLEGTRLGITAEIAADYFTLRAFDANKEMLLRTIEVHRKSLDLVCHRRARGLASDLDVAQAETLLKSAEVQAPASDLQRAKFQN